PLYGIERFAPIEIREEAVVLLRAGRPGLGIKEDRRDEKLARSDPEQTLRSPPGAVTLTRLASISAHLEPKRRRRRIRSYDRGRGGRILGQTNGGPQRCCRSKKDSVLHAVCETRGAGNSLSRAPNRALQISAFPAPITTTPPCEDSLPRTTTSGSRNRFSSANTASGSPGRKPRTP